MGQSSASVNVPVLKVQPAIYAGAVIHNVDNSLVTAERPLAAGEFAFVYATGFGPVSNEPATGAGAPSSPPAATMAAAQVTIAGLPCEVQFSGLAPGFVGVYQVNFRVPDNLPGGLQDLVISTSSAASPAIKVAVR